MRLKLPAPNRMRSVLVRVPILLITLTLLLLSFNRYPVEGFEEGKVCNEPTIACYNHNNALISVWKRKVGALGSQALTLQNEIAYLTTRVSLTEAEIENTKIEIKSLSGDIGDLSQRLERISSFLEFQEQIFVARAKSAYIADQLSSFDVILGSENLDEAIRQIKYLKVLETQDREVLEQIRDIRVDYNGQKALLEEKKADVEDLKKQLEEKQVSLNNQRTAQERLLALTKSSQARYKRLVEQARSTQETIAQLVFKAGTPWWSATVVGLSGPTRVSAGQFIGWMGNTGYPICSTGAHLHFQVMESVTFKGGRISGKLTNPLAYLQSRYVCYYQVPDNRYLKCGILGWGSWSWPMSTSGSFYVTQGYGSTPFAQIWYRNKFHTGVDMVNYSNQRIYAPAGGKLYSGWMACGSSYCVKVKIIDHGGGRFTIYKHLK